MPDLQANQTTFRAGNYTFSGYLCTPPETVVFSRAVNMASIADPLTAITYDDPYTGAGVFGDVPNDADVLLYSGNTSTQKGRLRVAYGGASSSVLQVNEVSAGRIAVANNDRFDVLDAYRLRDKLVGATETFPKDSRREYTDEGEESPPRVIVGQAAIKIVAPGATAEFTFNAAGSRPVDPNNSGFPSSSSGLSFLYDVGDGTITVGADTDPAITATFPVGFRWVILTVTDDDNAKSTVRKIPVFVFDGTTYSPIPVKRISYSLSRRDGGSGTLELLSNCGLDDLPEGAPVWYFEREWYDGTEASYGNMVADRSNIKLHGYLRRETITVNPDTDTLSVEIISPLLRLAEIGGFSQDLKTVENPANWQQDEQVTIHKLAWYVWHWHTTASLLYDLFIQDDDYDFEDFLVQQANVRAQMDEVTAGVSKLFTCDRAGRFLIARNLQRGTTTERAAADVTLALTVRDLREISDLTWEHAYQVAQVIGKAITSDGRPLLSVAPGEAPAEAPDITSFERLIVTGDAGNDQVELNTITSHGWAEANSLYNGLSVPKGVRLNPLTTMDVLDPAYPDWLALTLASSTNRRERSFSGDRFVLQSVEITADSEAGAKDLAWTVDHETLGQGATTRDVETDVAQPPYTPPDTTPQPTPIRLPFPPWNGALPTRAILTSAAGARCALVTSINPTTGALTYADRSSGLTGVGRWGMSNPFAYATFEAAQSTGIYRMSDVEAGGSFSLLMNNASLYGNAARQTHFVTGSIHRNGFRVALSGYSGLAYSFDGWLSRTISAIGGGSPDWTYSDYSAVFSSYCMVERTAGHGYGVFGINGDLYRTTDFCQTWNQVGGAFPFANDMDFRLEIPYTREDGSPNADDGDLELWVYMMGSSSNGTFNQVNLYTTDGTSGVSFVRGSLLNGGQAGHGALIIRPSTSFTHSALYGYATDVGWAVHTEDGFVTEINGGAVGGGNAYDLNGFSTNPNCAFAWRRLTGGGGNRAFFTTDGGVTWYPIVPDTSGWVADDGVAYLEGSLYPFQ